MENYRTVIKITAKKLMNVTMDELALKLGISKQAVYTWESGKKPIPKKRLEQLEELTGIPGNYFLVDDLMDRDKLEIRKYWLRKEIADTAEEYEEEVRDINGSKRVIQGQYIDTGLMQQMEYTEMELKTYDLLRKVERVIHGPEQLEGDFSYEEATDRMESNLRVIDRFADIVDKVGQTEDLYQILRATCLGKI